jgi:hypothetical protein
VLEAGKPLVTQASLRQRMRRLIVLGFNYLPEGRKAPKNTEPRGLPAEKVREEFGQKIGAMDETIARCEVRLGRGKLLDHPILGPLTGAQWRKSSGARPAPYKTDFPPARTERQQKKLKATL